MPKYAKLVVDIKNDFCNDGFDYIIPQELESFVGVGSRALVPFGSQDCLGYVLEINDTSSYTKDVKAIKELLDYEQELTETQIEIAKYITSTYYVSMVKVLELMIPSFLKGQKRKYIQVKDYDKLDPKLALMFEGKKRFPVDRRIQDVYNLIKKEINKGNISLNYDLYTYGNGKKKKEYYVGDDMPVFKSEKRRNIYEFVKNNPKVTEDDIIAYLDCTYNLIREMCKDETLKYHEVAIIDDSEQELENKSPYNFSSDDNMTYDRIKNARNKKFLLHSNREDFKINLYIKIIEDCKKKGLPVLITCPTIMLEEEILMYLKRYLKGYKIYGMSSKNTKKDRYEVFMNAKYDNLDCLVTTHNGIFMPFNNLGAIIVVDEDNPNYINENYPYYDGIEVLDKMSTLYNSLFLMTSISPSIKTYYKTNTGEYGLIVANDSRNGDNYELVDMKEEILNGSSSNISNTLKNAIRNELDLHHQVMLMVSNKAYLGMMRCRDCGKTLKCPNCGISLTYFKSKDYATCTYCGYKMLNYHVCPSCGGETMGLSYGEEKVSEEIQEMFSDARVLDVNADLMKKTEDYTKALNDIEENNVDIIIGTNILSKRIKSDNIKLVAIINADMYLNSNSHLANEQTFNLITKLNNKDRVIIQTFNKDAKIFKLACLDDYDNYYEEEIENRKILNYEPFMEINRITFTGEFKELYHAANYFKKFYQTALKKEILGPSYDSKIKGTKLILKHNDFDKVKLIVKDTREKFKSLRVQVNYERRPKVI